MSAGLSVMELCVDAYATAKSSNPKDEESAVDAAQKLFKVRPLHTLLCISINLMRLSFTMGGQRTSGNSLRGTCGLTVQLLAIA